MSTLITDTLKPKSTFPLMDAEDLDIQNESDLEVGLQPATDEKLGRVKVGETIQLDNGEISLPNFIHYGKDIPTDDSLLWFNINAQPEQTAEAKLQLISTKYKVGTNGLQLLEDGFYIQGTKGKYPQIFYLNGKPFMLIGDMTIYINASTGDDVNGDGSSAKPFKTWSKARSYLPRNMNHRNLTIYFSGDFHTIETYTDFEFYGGGWIWIRMQGTPKFCCMRFYGDSKYTLYENFSCQLTSSVGNYLGCITCYCGAAINITTEGTTAYTINLTGMSSANASPWSRGLYCSQGGMIQVNNSYITVKAATMYQAYLAETGGELDIYNPTGSSNIRYGLNAHTGGVVRYSKYSITIISGGSQRVTGTGGRIYTGAQSSMGNY